METSNTEREQKPLLRRDPAVPSAVAALEEDPFYRSISVDYAEDEFRRRQVLAEYFDYSIREGAQIGRSVHLPDPAHGVAVWLLPQFTDVKLRAAEKKRRFLKRALGAEGFANYCHVLRFMSAKSTEVVQENAWYLSIVAVDPALQGQGLGRRLLEPTIAEANRAGADCYLETFSPDNVGFYERLGFRSVAQFREPTADTEYVVMVRLAVAKNRGGSR